MLLFMAAIPALRRFYPGRPMLVPVLLGLTAGEMATAVGSTPITYLRKEMRFKEVAILQVLTSISMTAVGPLMAWRGWGVWAIVGERVSGTVVATLVVWAFIRPWRLRLALDSRMARWYLSYGRFVSATQALDKVLSDFDDFWVGTVLGAQPLGYYSKAYELAGYPRRVVSDPVVQVLFPAFAEAQHDQLRLSRAYFRASCLVVRVGFLLAGCLVLSASALVPLMLGGRWTPMTSAFQLMVVYALLIPLMSVTGNLVNAVGHPELTTRTRAAQSIILVPAVIIGARWWSINGVALATDVVLLLGLLLLLRQSRRIVEVSFKSMLLLPTLALLAGILLGLASTAWLDATTVMALLFRLGGFLIVYNGLLVVFEGKQYRSQLRVAYEAFSGGPLDLSSERIGLCLRRWLRVHD
jgi:PST family polysaccharide transporter